MAQPVTTTTNATKRDDRMRFIWLSTGIARTVSRGILRYLAWYSWHITHSLSLWFHHVGAAALADAIASTTVSLAKRGADERRANAPTVGQTVFCVNRTCQRRSATIDQIASTIPNGQAH